MENAVKALIIAAGVLIGLMILSLGLSLYTSLNEFVEDYEEKIAIQKIQQFNEQFTKYINYDAGTTAFVLTIQDIVTAANAAYQNNQTSDSEVIINLDGNRIDNDITTDSAEILQGGLGESYICKPNDVIINQTTGKVESVDFLTR